MSFPVKGSVIVADGNGKVAVISPTSDNQVLSLDSTDPRGAKFIDVKKILPQQFIKAQATSANSTNSTTYERIISLTVPGENVNPITAIKVLSSKDGNVTNYDVRVQTDLGVTIAEANFNNSNTQINDLGTLSNLPLTETLLEIQAKRNGGNNNSGVYIFEVTINYNNV